MEKKTREELKALSYTEKIDYYAHINDLISVNNGNHKTGIVTFRRKCISCSKHGQVHIFTSHLQYMSSLHTPPCHMLP